MPKYNQQNGVVCHGCGGKGKIDTVGIETCGHCAGTGRDKTSDLWAEPCRNCNGKGKVTYARKEECRTCHGSGRLPY